MILKGLSAIAKGLFIIYSTTHNNPSLLIQVSVEWYSDADLGILYSTAGAIKGGLIQSCCLQIYNIKYGFAKKIYKFLASRMEVFGKWFLLNAW